MKGISIQNLSKYLKVRQRSKEKKKLDKIKEEMLENERKKEEKKFDKIKEEKLKKKKV